MLNAGADKVSINTAAVTRPEFVKEAAERFGSQCIVVAIDAKCQPPIPNPQPTAPNPYPYYFLFNFTTQLPTSSVVFSLF